MTARNSYLLRKYGISEKSYNDLLRRQNRACAICRTPAESFSRKLAVDHDHSTGEVRGLLCFRCNKFVVGRHRRDTIQELYDYLARQYTGWFVPPPVKKKKRKAKRVLRSRK